MVAYTSINQMPHLQIIERYYITASMECQRPLTILPWYSGLVSKVEGQLVLHQQPAAADALAATSRLHRRWIDRHPQTKPPWRMWHTYAPLHIQFCNCFTSREHGMYTTTGRHCSCNDAPEISPVSFHSKPSWAWPLTCAPKHSRPNLSSQIITVPQQERILNNQPM
jgi:hypothetical protein